MTYLLRMIIAIKNLALTTMYKLLTDHNFKELQNDMDGQFITIFGGHNFNERR